LPFSASAAPKKDMAPTQPVITGQEATQISLTVKIVSARDLRKDELGVTDPFVKCTINGNPRATFSTKVVSDCVNPIWNCSAEVSGLALNDIIRFEVFNKDCLWTDSLGHCGLDVRSAMNSGCAEGSWPTERKLASTRGAGKVSTNDSWLKLEVSNIMQVSGSAPHAVKLLDKPSGNQPKVMVTIVGARNLRKADLTSQSDPYCVCQIPYKRDSLLQTPMIRDEPNPSWDYTGQIANIEEGDTVVFTVLDDDILGSDLLGRCTVKFEEMNSLSKSKKITKKLQDHGKDINDAEIDLEFVVTDPK